MRPGEVALVLASCIYFFCLLGSNYVLRPIRDEMGISGGSDKLPWLFTGTLVATLLANPIFSWLVARNERKRFITWTYRFFALNLVIFFALLRGRELDPDLPKTLFVPQIFFVWMSVFNLFVLSVFWGFMADVWTHAQSKRLYGLIGAGGTVGAIAGSELTSRVMDRADHPDAAYLLLVVVLMLEVCVQIMRWISRRAGERAPERVDAPAAIEGTAAPRSDKPERASALAGIRLVLQRPYLRSLCLYVLLQTICATILYYLQANIVSAAIPDRAQRIVFLADNSAWVNYVSLVVQIFFTAHILRFFGIAITLVVLPLIGMIGFASLGASPGLTFVRWSQILSRSCEFATGKPARETLFTVVSRAEKYQSKALIDTFIYRGGDALGGWMFEGLQRGLGMGLTAISYTFVPVAAVWAGVAWVLGRRQEALARSKEAQSR